MKKLKKIVAIISLLSFTVILAACGSENNSVSDTETPEISEKGELKTVRIGSAGFKSPFIFDVLAISIDLGYLDEELAEAGYEAEYIEFNNGGSGVAEALATGDLDIGDAGDFPSLISVSSDIDTKVIAVANGSMHMGVLATEESGIESVKDLEGKRVIIVKGSSSEYYFQSLVKEYDLDENSIEILNNGTEAASLLQAGEADALAINLSMVDYYADLGLGHVVTSTVEDVPTTSQLFITARQAFLEEEPEAAVAVNKAMIRAYNYVIETVGKGYGYDFVTDSVEQVTNPGISQNTYDQLNKVYTFMYDAGYLSGEVDINDFVESTYYEKAQKELEE